MLEYNIFRTDKQFNRVMFNSSVAIVVRGCQFTTSKYMVIEFLTEVNVFFVDKYNSI